MNKTIPFYIESINGHDTTLVPVEDVADKTNEQLGNDKWATIQKESGETQVLTKEVPKEQWKDVFTDVKSVTATSKMKGG